MFLKSKILYLHVESPLHAGAGSGLGAIDLPIQRERTTGYPQVHASGIKGALRDSIKDSAAKEIEAIFGPDPEAEAGLAHAGAFSPGDARILIFPVRSLKGVFAWVTSINVLQRWQRDIKDVVGEDKLIELPLAPQSTRDVDYCYASPGVLLPGGKVVLEEYVFENQNEDSLSDLAERIALTVIPDQLDDYWKKLLQSNLVILPDDLFKDFVNHATEVRTRTRLEPDSKTVVSGALWTEELLPMDTVLYSPIRATRIRMNKEDMPDYFKGDAEKQAEEVLNWLVDKIDIKIQIGGNETVGCGLVNLKWHG